MSKVVKVLKDTLNDIDGIKKFVEIDLKDVYFDSVLHPEKPGYAYLITIDKNGMLDVYESLKSDYIPYQVRKGEEFIISKINADIGNKKFRNNTEVKIEEMSETTRFFLRKEIECFLPPHLYKLECEDDPALSFYKKNYPEYYYKYYSYNNAIMLKENDLIYKNIEKDWHDFTKEKLIFSIKKSLIRLVLNLEQQVITN